MAPRSRGEESCFQMGVASMSGAGELTKRQSIGGWEVLSMGMSGDYDIALECGATHVRLGSSIFGARNYSA